MKTTFFKTLCVLALVFALLLPAFALGEARYPELGGALTDDANALGQSMTRDIAAYAEKVESKTGVKLHVALVLFLDGETAQTYADTLFARWELGENDLLLVGAAAEGSFALSAGESVTAKLSAAGLKNLLYSSGFSDAFKAQRYDEAFGVFFESFNQLLAKQYGAEIKLDELFTGYVTAGPTATQAPQPTATRTPEQAAIDTVSDLWTTTMDSIAGNVQDYQDYHNSRGDSATGLTPWGWLVLVIIVLIIFGQSNTARRARGRGGCGCSPIGWIIGGLGLGVLFGHRNGGGPRRGPGGFGRPPRR